MTRPIQYLLAVVLCLVVSSAGVGQRRQERLENLRTLSEFHDRAGRDEDLPDKCGLPILSAALHDRATLSTTQQSTLTALLVRPSLHTSIHVGSFRVHFDTTGPDAPAMLDSLFQPIPGTARRYVDSVASILQHTWSFQTSVLGYLSPPQDGGGGGGPEYDVYIEDLGSSYYGLTTPEDPTNSKPDGGTFTTFLEIDNDFSFVHPDSNKGLPALRVTIAHELHHAIQIGQYGYWTGDSYFYEITSVWMEDVVYTNVNDYYQYLRSQSGHFWHPETPFTSNSFIVYSRGIWGNFIAKRYGRDLMRRAWEEIRAMPPLQAMDAALRADTSSFRQALSEWSLWNLFTGSRSDSLRYYPEGNFYPPMVKSPVAFSPPSRSMDGSLKALTAKYYEVLGMPDTLTLVLSNTNLSAGFAKSDAQFPYTYALNVERVDESYKSTPVGIYFKFIAPDLTNWFTWDVVRNGVGGTGANAVGGIPFPNPFVVTGNTTLRIPISSSVPTTGTLYVFTASMDLVFSADLTSREQFAGQQAFEWNGDTSTREMIRTGVYFFVLNIGDQTTTGKIAVIRQ